MRRENIAEGEYYHLVNRGNQHQQLFYDKSDWARFLFLILYYQSPKSFRNVKRNIASYLREGTFGISDDVDVLIEDRAVELINFCIMPNHFHLTVYNVTYDGISQYMHRVQNAYGKYFNTKHERKGYVFEGPYRAVRMRDDNQISYLSTYIHKNPRQLQGWEERYPSYPWSSFQDYTEENRWGNLISPSIILSTFSDKERYGEFVENSAAKEFDSFLLEP